MSRFTFSYTQPQHTMTSLLQTILGVEYNLTSDVFIGNTLCIWYTLELLLKNHRYTVYTFE